MENNNLFTVNDTSFHKKVLRRFIKRSGKKVVALIDIGMGINYSNSAFTKGFAEQIYIKNYKGEYLKGWVWPGAVHYPDFLHPKSQRYWSDIFSEFYQDFPFSGVWLDMNEITNFCDAECVDPVPLEAQISQYPYTYDNIPYNPGFLNLENKTLSLLGYHFGNFKEYDIHSLNSLMHAHATFGAMKNLKKSMPFIVSRGTFPGSGRYAAHWTGDNESTWLFLQLSIPSLFNFNIFGIPMVGADICGFMGNTTEELCARWIQVGALYPLARNHNHESSIDQEFDSFGPTLIQTARVNLKLRYSILRYYYSLMIENVALKYIIRIEKLKFYFEKAETGTIIKPLFFLWSRDQNLYKDEILDTHFLIGNNLLAIPLVRNDSNFSLGYLPEATWYSFHNHRKIIGNGFFSLWHIPLNQTLPLFIKHGAVISVQDVASVKSSADLNNIYDLVVTLQETSRGIVKDTEKADYSAEGNLISLEKYGEDNIYKNCVEKNYSCLYKINVQAEILSQDLKISMVFTHYNNSFDEDRNKEEVLIRDISILGLQSPVDHLFHQDDIRAVFEIQGKKWIKKIKIKKKYFENFQGNELQLTLRNMNLSVYHNLTISFITDQPVAKSSNILLNVLCLAFVLFYFFNILYKLCNFLNYRKL